MALPPEGGISSQLPRSCQTEAGFRSRLITSSARAVLRSFHFPAS